MSAVSHQDCGFKVVLNASMTGSVVVHGISGQRFECGGHVKLYFHEGDAFVSDGTTSTWLAGDNNKYDLIYCRTPEGQC